MIPRADIIAWQEQAPEFVDNLDAKAGDRAFREDVLRLLGPDVEFDYDQAVALIREQLLARL